jgi:L-malate glycosyltransferase
MQHARSASIDIDSYTAGANGLSVAMVLDGLYPSPGGGGAESQVRTLSRRMTTDGAQVQVVVPMLSYGSQVASDQIDGVPVTRVRYPHVPGIGAAVLLVRLAWLLWRRRASYEIIHAHIAGNMAAMCALMGWLLRKPVLVKITGLTEMAGGILDANVRPGVRLRRALLRLATGYQATSTRIAGMLRQHGFRSDKIQLIPNAVDTERFDHRTRNLQLRKDLFGDKRLVGVYVGRFEAVKGVELLIHGWASVFSGRYDAMLLLVGNGSLRAQHEATCRSLGIAEQVMFAGPRDRVEDYLAVADFGILPSLHEGLSNTLLEYMAAGLPVLGSRVSGTEDFVINDQTGWIFAPGNEADFVEMLTRVREAAREELHRLGAKAHQLVSERASIGSVVEQLGQAYRNTVRAS